jgi:hypothetical protein
MRKEDMTVVDDTEESPPEVDLLMDNFPEEDFSIEERLNQNDTP